MIKSPNISPIDSLVDLACRDGVDVRPTLLRVVTDLYVQKTVHSDDETTQYVELALGLIDTVDEPTRAAVATTLSHYAGAPAAVLNKLAAVKSSTTAPLALPPVSFVPDETTAVPAHGTQAASVPVTAAAAFSADDSLTDVFLNAGGHDRQLILFNLDVVANPDAALAPASNETVLGLEDAALKRDPAAFARLLERAIGIRRHLADRIAQDVSGEPIVVIAKALGIKAAVLQRILLFLNPAIGQSVQRVFDLATLYDEISMTAAMHMVSIWRQDAPALTAKARHEPVYQEDGRAVRRPIGREARRSDARELTAPHKATR
ncbi:MAG: DUF2336 domain-containing protein [Pseudolabrys sp.]|jgi:hypothetical protein